MVRLHETNLVSNTFGHACHDMPYHVFEMITEMKSLMANNSWLEKEKFHEAKVQLDALPDDSFNVDGKLKQSGKQTTMEQWCDFFVEFQTTMEKTFIALA